MKSKEVANKACQHKVDNLQVGPVQTESVHWQNFVKNLETEVGQMFKEQSYDRIAVLLVWPGYGSVYRGT